MMTKHPKGLHVLAAASALMLAACGEAEKPAEKPAQPAETAAPSEAETAVRAAAEKAVAAAKEQAEDLISKLTIDASSFESFQSSLAAMQGELSSDQISSLTSAMQNIAKESASSGEGLLGAATSLASGASAEDTLYKAIGDQINGLTFEEILEKAN